MYRTDTQSIYRSTIDRYIDRHSMDISIDTRSLVGRRVGRHIHQGATASSILYRYFMDIPHTLYRLSVDIIVASMIIQIEAIIDQDQIKSNQILSFFLMEVVFIILYYMAGSASGQDEANPVFD